MLEYEMEHTSVFWNTFIFSPICTIKLKHKQPAKYLKSNTDWVFYFHQRTSALTESEGATDVGVPCCFFSTTEASADCGDVSPTSSLLGDTLVVDPFTDLATWDSVAGKVSSNGGTSELRCGVAWGRKRWTVLRSRYV